MADNFSDDNLNSIISSENVGILTKISWKFAHESQIDKSALVQVMACQQIADKPLAESMLTQFTDALMCLPASIC